MSIHHTNDTCTRGMQNVQFFNPIRYKSVSRSGPLLGTFVFKGVIRQHQFYFGHPMKKVFAGE